jgi:hypothetical protein
MLSLNRMCLFGLMFAVVLAGCSPSADKSADKKQGMEGKNVADSPEAKEVAKLSDTDRPLAEAQKFCPITGKLLGSMGVPRKVTVQGETVFLCCDSCDARALADPAKTLEKLKAVREKAKK